ncbi:MAG: hypothetical protein IRZ32_12110 [Solirubrobacteraceae bacterium]|nr:hypothetical protein [Solirubrobacteraceae bacterium]
MIAEPVLWALVGLALGLVVVRRRSAGVAVLAAQSLLLGVIAVDHAVTEHGSVPAAVAILVIRGVVLPLVLVQVIRLTREPRRVASERSALLRFVLALAVALVAIGLAPPLGLHDEAAGDAALALVVLGIAVAALRRPVVFQAIGFLVAENGVLLAGLAVSGGLPAIVELGLLVDLVLAVGVAGAFGARIHERFGTSDTSVLRSLRD